METREHYTIKRLGRPLIEKPNTATLGIAISEESKKELQEYCEKLGVSVSYWVREAIEEKLKRETS